jgi:hypothetical protein
MLGSIFGTIGSLVGNLFGGGVLSSAGRFLGKWIGESLENDDELEEHFTIGRVRDKLYPISFANGNTIPLVFGTCRVEGQLIWSESIKEVPVTEATTRIFKHKVSIHNRTEFHYYCNFALGICEGEISDISRIWANSELIDLKDYTHRIYYGSEEQMPDPKIQEKFGADFTPAFRGLAYIVFEDFPLIDFGNNIPKLSFEVTRKPAESGRRKLENKIKAVNIIPGSGEYVYDTRVQTRKIVYEECVIRELKINCNNSKNIADSLFGMSYLSKICKEVEWVSVVVCWFGDSLDISRCSIYPAVENPITEGTEYSEAWQVGRFGRSNARIISKNEYGVPNYGGTINDMSLIRYLREVKSLGYKIALYPMIFMDIEGKPWRGRLTGDASFVREFFNKDDGYNNFIIHYTNLCRGLFDTILIGSELKSLTSIKDGENFPAVSELVRLAHIVKSSLDSSVKVSYAADWSEYHHTDGGWYHLDELWSSDDIDFIGIDNYMPLTESISASPTYEEIFKGFNSGEGYEYYTESGKKRELDIRYAWKNIKWWWENIHINPDGRRTRWVPKSKKIWFTEYGFPSIDKATNQPNIFYDPRSIDGGSPRNSNKLVDNSIQRKGIEAFIDFWSQEEYVDEMFLWCFDIRPYPEWPHAKIWDDHKLWSRGHWINGKLGGVLLSDVLKETSLKCDINEMIDFSGTEHVIFDVCLRSKISAIEFINILRCSYFFSISTNYNEGVEFCNYHSGQEVFISEFEFLQNENNIIKEEIVSQKHLISKLDVRYLSQEEEYKDGFCTTRSDEYEGEFKEIKFPFAMNNEDARRVGNIIIQQSHSSRKIYKLRLPIGYFFIKVGDRIKTNILGSKYSMRVLFVKFEGMVIDLICCDIETMNLDVCLNSKKDEIAENSGGVMQVIAENLHSIFATKIIFFINNAKIQKPLFISCDGKYFEKIKDIKPNISEAIIINSSFIEIRFDVISSGYIDIYVEEKNLKQIRDLRDIKSGIIINQKLLFVGNIAKISDNLFRLREIIFPLSDQEYQIRNGDKATFLDFAYHAEFEEFTDGKIFYRSEKSILEVL